MSIVTLSTDFKGNDFIVGAMKGMMLTFAPTINLVDITHALSYRNYHHACYVCRNACAYFPQGSIHVILIDLFNDHFNRLLLTEWKGSYYLTPDNGIITLIIGQKPLNTVVIDVVSTTTTIDIIHQVARIVAELEKGKYIRQLGREAKDLLELYPLRPSISTNNITGKVLFVDEYENAITNITKEDFDIGSKGRRFELSAGKVYSVDRIFTNYAEAADGDALAWFNSAQHLELSMKKGRTAAYFGLREYGYLHAQSPYKDILDTVKIDFFS